MRGETATAERINRDGGAVEVATLVDERSKTVYRQRIIGAPLDRLEKLGLLRGREYIAGDQFRSDAYYADVAKGAPTVDWGRPGGGGQRSFAPAVLTVERMREASDRYERAKRAFARNSRTWTVLVNGLVHEHSFREIGHNSFGFRDEREATVAGRTGFVMGLATLADHYQL